MTWNSPATWSTNEEVTSTKMTQQVYDNMRWLNEDRPRLTMAGTVAVANSSSFVVPTWNSDAACSPNAGGMLSSASVAYMAVPTAGSYQFSLMVIFNTSDQGKRGAVISSAAVSGSYVPYAQDMRGTTGSSETTSLTITTPLVKFNSTGYVHFGIRQQSTVSMNCTVRFSGLWIAS